MFVVIIVAIGGRKIVGGIIILIFLAFFNFGIVERDFASGIASA
jgi:hypothetical protein